KMIARAVALSFLIAVVSGQKTMGVRGILTCGGRPMPGANVTMGTVRNWPNLNRVFASVNSDAKGYFELFGTARGIHRLKPIVKVTHSCNFSGNITNAAACERAVTYPVPEEYIAKSTTKIGKWYHLETTDMAIVQVNEMGRCSS
ncbi:hypothetical protein PRIPAC_81367, partial [Pristionchus pacificus]